MKVFVITLALAGLASAATLDAQVGGRPVPSSSGSINVDASWRVAGRDRNGNTIYERRVRDANGNILVQSAVRDQNGNMRIISSRTEVVNNRDNRDNRGRGNDCAYTRSTNTVGDIIFGRSNDRTCDDVGSRLDGGWYQVGPGRNGRDYVRRIRDSRGRLVIQRARRERNGRFTIVSTRYATDNDKEWNKANRDYEKAVDRSERDQYKGKRP